MADFGDYEPDDGFDADDDTIDWLARAAFVDGIERVHRVRDMRLRLQAAADLIRDYGGEVI